MPATAGSVDFEKVERLMPLVYDELSRIAHGAMGVERRNHTLQTRALVHEAVEISTYAMMRDQEQDAPVVHEHAAHLPTITANDTTTAPPCRAASTGAFMRGFRKR